MLAAIAAALRLAYLALRALLAAARLTLRPRSFASTLARGCLALLGTAFGAAGLVLRPALLARLAHARLAAAGFHAGTARLGTPRLRVRSAVGLR